MSASVTIRPSTDAVPFRYDASALGGRPKAVRRLAATPTIVAAVQTVGPEGANNLHAHRYREGVWFVLAGRARFHGQDGVLAELGVHDGIVIPRAVPYWFESVGDEPLQILQVEASDRPNPVASEDRIDLDGPAPAWVTGSDAPDSDRDGQEAAPDQSDTTG